MTAKNPRTFNEQTRSKLWDVYDNFQDVLNFQPSIRCDKISTEEMPNETCVSKSIDDKRLTLQKLQRKIIDSVDFCRDRTKQIEIEEEFDIKVTNEVFSELFSIQKQDKMNSSSVRVIKVQDFKSVLFVHSSVQKTKNGIFRLTPPMFTIQVPRCLPNTVQNLNTGYIIEIPQKIESRQILDGKIIKKTNTAELQEQFIIIPQISCLEPTIVPSLQARDADDTGQFTVNIYNRLGNECTIYVRLHAFTVVRMPTDCVRFVNGDSTDITAFKTKDTKENRFVYNLQTRLLFNEAEITKRCLRLKCYDPTKSVHNNLLDKQLIIDNVTVFFSSRKREWTDPKLLTISGLFRPFGRSILPRVSKNSEFSINTHCCAFIKNRSVLFTVSGTLQPFHLCMNGALFDILNYKELKKAAGVLARDAKTMRTKARIIKQTFNEREYDEKLLMNLVDYEYQLHVDERFKNIYNKAEDHEFLFNNTSDTVKRAISSRMFNNFKFLASVFCTNNLKRKNIDGSDNYEESKKNKKK